MHEVSFFGRGGGRGLFSWALSWRAGAKRR